MMEFFGNRLSSDQVDAIVQSFMTERYGDEDRDATWEDIRFALQFYVKKMTGEPNIYVHQGVQGDWVWDIIEENVEDEAFYDHQN